MIDFNQAKEIAQKQYPQFRLDQAYDDGGRFIFSYAMKQGDGVPEGIPFIAVSKQDGTVSEIPVPPIENLDFLDAIQEIPL